MKSCGYSENGHSGEGVSDSWSDKCLHPGAGGDSLLLFVILSHQSWIIFLGIGFWSPEKIKEGSIAREQDTRWRVLDKINEAVKGTDGRPLK